MALSVMGGRKEAAIPGARQTANGMRAISIEPMAQAASSTRYTTGRSPSPRSRPVMSEKVEKELGTGSRQICSACNP